MNLPTPPSYDGTNKSWAEVNRWAMRNHGDGGWSLTYADAQHAGMTEVELLRRLSFALLRGNVELSNRAVRQAEQAIPTFVLPGNPLPAHLQPDAPFLRCSVCGRKSYNGDRQDSVCNLKGPDGHKCEGVFQ